MSVSAGESLDAIALRLDPSRRVTLKFRLTLATPEDFGALHFARRSMIRDERTKGLEWDEPSVEEATLTSGEIRWFVLASQAEWCRRKVSELIDRANRVREETEGSRLK